MARFFNQSNILKIALFATGLSGIVAEYVLSTLATYFLGNAVVQWTLVLSTMLFSMGLGSRLSKFIGDHLLEKFVVIEFLLSFLVSFCACATYLVSSFSSFNDSLWIFSFNPTAIIIYALSVLVGLLIGLEIPLVARLNQHFEELKVNISSVMEKDYYGSLLGGIFFAFVGLPFLGLTYTPFVLGGVNFIVAIILLFALKNSISISWFRRLNFSAVFLFLLISTGGLFANKIINYGEQKRYLDRVVFQKQTAYQRLVVTRWKDDFWFYINGNLQLSTLDEELYHEPLVHPAMLLHPFPQKVLVLGGGDGCAVREIVKYNSVDEVVLVDLDSEVTQLAKDNPIFLSLNDSSLWNTKVKVVNEDAFSFVNNSNLFFDVIIMDFPDPKSIDLGRLYSYEFYSLCNKHLRPNGLVVTQAGSPYFATNAFLCIDKTLTSVGFSTLPLHNQVLTLGEWGWIVGSKEKVSTEALRKRLCSINIPNDLPTTWLNEDAFYLISSFGKNVSFSDSTKIDVNYIHKPVLVDYYRKGNWELY